MSSMPRWKMSEETPLRIEFYPSGAIHLFNLKADEESLGISMNKLIKFLKNIYKDQLESCQPKSKKLKQSIHNPQVKEDKQLITRSTLPQLEENHTKLNSMRTAQQPVDTQSDGRRAGSPIRKGW